MYVDKETNFWDSGLFARGQVNRNNGQKVFDWDKAAQIIKEKDIQDAEAGLAEDWTHTNYTIIEGGKPTERDPYSCGAYLSSTWATPILMVGDEPIECYVMESQTEWDHNTHWPESALKILETNDQ